MKPEWVIDGHLETSDNGFTIGGILAAELAEEHDTPLFVFSENRIRHNLKQLLKIQDVINCKLKVCYAAKANSNSAILKSIRDAGSDIEVNSGGELFLALKAGFKGDQIIFNGTSKSEKEIVEAIEAEIYAIQADSLFEVELINKAAKRLGRRANVSLRLVPEIETETLHGLQTALLTSKFGMMPEEALEAFDRWGPDDPSLNLCGIHLHIGSQNPSEIPYSQALVSLFENLLRIFKETGHKLTHLNIGGGFPVNYLRDESNASQIDSAQRELFSAELKPGEVIRMAWEGVMDRAKDAAAEHLLADIELLIEPGRSVIADAGVCLTRVRNKKERPVSRMQPDKKDTWLMTDAGFNILLSMETYKWYYHLISAERSSEDHR
ncbi:MAG: hypothetical protein HKN25_17835, partial [Pyrinomonadaceae bacterium]|nr:hypothetical protein [Pyrinomonadaceae bacterium]